jgi:glycosyltransferase involved in cell wall biosynthesis
MDSITVSIVMAAYNEEKYISEAIQSVLEQSFRDFEFIIINDGSTDSTEKIILSFNDPRIIYVKNEQNLKLIASLNKGLRIARGKYIARMDADDICFKERLEKQVDFMEKNPDTGISGAQLKIFGETEGMMNYPLRHDEIKLRLLLTSCFGNNVVIFRKELMDKHNLFFPEGYFHAEDYKCWTNWIKVSRLANIPEALVKYRSHSGSVSVKHRSAQRETRNRVRAEYVEEIFNLQDYSLASDFTGELSSKRIAASRSILKMNEKMKCFKQEELTNMVYKLWYSDSLEQIEKKFSVFFMFPLIFKLSFGSNFKNWIYLFKHYFKVKFA